MAERAPITPAPSGATLFQRAEQMRTAADCIACLTELVSDQLASLRAGVRQHCADLGDTAEWHNADILLHLAAEQAASILRMTERGS